MSKISDDNSYNIDDLVNVWEAGWQHLKKFAELQSSYKPKVFDESEHYLLRLLSVIDDVLCPYFDIGKYFNAPDPCPKYIELLNLAASDKSNPYTPIVETERVLPYPYINSPWLVTKSKNIYKERLGDWSKDKLKLKKAIEKLTAAFTKSDTIESVLSKIADNQNLKLFKEFWLKRDFDTNNFFIQLSWAEKDYLKTSISPQIKEVMKWLGHGTKDKNAFDEAWWNCLWLFMKPKVEQMLQMQQFINKDKPLCLRDIDMLRYYLGYGRPVINLTKKGDAYQPEIVLKPKESELERFVDLSPVSLMSIILLVQPAFDLSQKFQNQFLKPRYLVQCHAPSCSKFFYTQRKTQVVCGSINSSETSACRKEWFRYIRWLKNLNKNPKKDWNNPKLITPFLQKT